MFFLLLGEIAIENLDKQSPYVLPLLFQQKINHICFEAIVLILLSHKCICTTEAPYFLQLRIKSSKKYRRRHTTEEIEIHIYNILQI